MVRALSLLVGLFSGGIAVAQVDDHLLCRKVTDPLAVRAMVTLDSDRFGLAPGCSLTPAKLFCTPATKTITHSDTTPLAIAGPPLVESRVCYKVHCAQRPGDQQESDQFGTHALRKLVPRLLCPPAVPGPPAATTTALDHLACYAAKDSAKVSARVNVASLPVPANGCKIARAKLVCVGGSATVVSSNVPALHAIGGPGLDVDRVCYRVACAASLPVATTMSDRFGQHDLTLRKAHLLCTPAVEGPPPPPTTTSTTTPATTTTSTTVPGGDPALTCQGMIEAQGIAYANAVLDVVEQCAALGAPDTISGCLGSPATTATLDAQKTTMRNAIAAACAGVDVWRDLGYLTTCDAPPSSCTSASGTLASLSDCFACKMKETFLWAADRLYANVRPAGGCRTALASGGLTALRGGLADLVTCLGQPGTISIASCFNPDATIANWRAQAESACSPFNPFTTLGYPMLCSGDFQTSPAFCGVHARPCTFAQMSKLSTPATDDDLLDCLGCQVEEAMLATARTLHGANLCCVAGKCDTIRTRFSCREAGGSPVQYRIDTRDVGPISGPHGIDIGDDGSLYIADSGYARATKVAPNGTVTVLSSTPSFPVGIAVAPNGDVYVTNRCEHQVKRIPAGGGSIAPFAGSGTPGNSGDGGPALAANIAAPDGVAVDQSGRVFFTQSQTLGLLCGTFVGGEAVRYVDTGGTMHTLLSTVPAIPSSFGIVYGLHFGFDGTLYIGEAGYERVFTVDPMGGVHYVAGRTLSPAASHSGYGGPALRARFYENCGVDGDLDGNTLVAPMIDNRIALVDRLGSVIAIAGTGEGNFSPAGDGGPGLLAEAACPEDLAVAPDGRIYFSDLTTNRIRVLTRIPY